MPRASSKPSKDPPASSSDFGGWLSGWMARTGKSDRVVARGAGVSGPTVLQWRRGARPKLENVQALATAFRLDYPSLARLAGYPVEVTPGFFRALEQAETGDAERDQAFGVLGRALEQDLPETPEFRRLGDVRFLRLLLWMAQLPEDEFQALWSMVEPQIDTPGRAVPPPLGEIRSDLERVRPELEALDLYGLPDPIGRLVMFGLGLPKGDRDLLLRQAEAVWRLAYLPLEETESG